VDSSFKSRMLAGMKISDPVAVIVAHPDDEIIGMGGRISMLETLTLIHATNGAPTAQARLKKKGFIDVKSYSSARFSEVDRALGIVGANPVAHIRYDYPDGELVLRLMEMIERLQSQLRDVSAVITHAYEGGHPDHDACAFATQYAIQRLEKSGCAPPSRLELTSYFSLNGRMRVGKFWPDSQKPGTFVHLTRNQRRRKLEALKAFETQEWIPKVFGARREMYREAPNYDFRRPPPPRNWLYDAHGWSISGQIWLEHAGRALDHLGRLDQ
jgi:LmbE family N-acetylglucosaminyl deacetylase